MVLSEAPPTEDISVAPLIYDCKVLSMSLIATDAPAAAVPPPEIVPAMDSMVDVSLTVRVIVP